jgi:repressor LexA
MAHTPPGNTRKKVLRYMRRRLEKGTPPSVREVQEAFGFRSVESARAHLEALVGEGSLVKRKGEARGYRLPGGILGGEREWMRVPLVGRVQAGGWTEAVEGAEGCLVMPARSPDDDAYFALRVHGESMTGAGILPGDVVIVHRQGTARSGDVVVALLEDEATVKTLRLRGQRVVLEPANPDFEPLMPDPAALLILGKVVEVRRYLDGVPLEEWM